MSFEGMPQQAEVSIPTTTEAGTPSVATETDANRPSAVQTDSKDPFADNFARLVRRERQLKERESKLSDFEKRLAEYEARDKLAQDDPFALLEKYGLNFDKLSQKLIEDPVTPEKRELQELKAKMARWEEEKGQEAAKRKEQETQSAYENAKRELNELLEKDPEKFELVRMQNAHELVFQVIYEFQQAHGKWLSFEEAATKVEEHLEKDVTRLLEAKKLKSKLAPKIENPPEDSMGSNAGESHGATSPTLSNIAANHSTPRPDGRVSDEELMKRAMAVMRNG